MGGRGLYPGEGGCSELDVMACPVLYPASYIFYVQFLKFPILATNTKGF